MARRTGIHRLRLVILLVSTLVQLPALALVSTLATRIAAGAGFVPYVIAALLTAPYVLLRPREWDRPKPPLLRWFVYAPFFAWWATSFLYLVLGGIAWVAAGALGADRTAAGAAALALAALGGLWSVRRSPRLVELEVPVQDLDPAFDGYRVGHLTDVHLGSFTSRALVEEWVVRLNAARPDLIAVTGDLITSGDAFTEDVAAALSGLDAPDGVFACMGNHDYFCDAERLVAALRDGGLRVLRNEGELVTRGDAALHVAGIEDWWTRRSDMKRTLSGRRPGVPTLLLAHDPNHFPAAVEAGVELVLSGHTHGGQIALPGGGGRLNLARLITRFTHGLFSDGRSRLYVSRGAGTTGPPVRLFAPAELTILTLRAA